jgi:hypothetical protein
VSWPQLIGKNKLFLRFIKLLVNFVRDEPTISGNSHCALNMEISSSAKWCKCRAIQNGVLPVMRWFQLESCTGAEKMLEKTDQVSGLSSNQQDRSEMISRSQQSIDQRDFISKQILLPEQYAISRYSRISRPPSRKRAEGTKCKVLPEKIKLVIISRMVRIPRQRLRSSNHLQ